MKSSVAATALLAAALAAGTAAAAPFRIVYLDREAVTVVDAGGVQREGAGARYLKVILEARPRPVKGKPPAQQLDQQIEADCAGRRLRVVRATLRAADGTELFSREAAGEWWTVAADTVDASELDFACQGLAPNDVAPLPDLAAVQRVYAETLARLGP